jgi:hypothetical protein
MVFTVLFFKMPSRNLIGREKFSCLVQIDDFAKSPKALGVLQSS